MFLFYHNVIWILPKVVNTQHNARQKVVHLAHIYMITKMLLDFKNIHIVEVTFHLYFS